MVREPAVAGAFYPEDGEDLRKLLNQIFSRVEDVEVKGRVIGGVSPHAGYIYSGIVAAHLYKILKFQSFKTVILIGPSHYIPFRGVSVYDGGIWRTPLGDVEIDEKLARMIVKNGKYVKGSPELHQREHSIEVQVPFLQYIKGKDFKIVPVMMGTQDKETILDLIESIYTSIKGRDDVVIIASSDLYHGYSYEECEKRDSKLESYVKGMDLDGFIDAFESEEVMACGGGPIAVVMGIASRLGASPHVLMRTNSNDVMGQIGGYVVGYMSVAFVKEEDGNFRLSDSEKVYLLKLARKTLEDVLSGKKAEIPEDVPRNLKKVAGVFTTLEKRGNLRGCIGYPVGIKPLYIGVIETAQKAALEDPRFPPVSYDELKDIEIEITVLTPLQEVKNLEEVEVGRDGLLVKYGPYQGLLLPQVPVEYNWDRQTFIEQTCVKAGLPPNAYRWKGIKFYKFQGIIFKESDFKL